MNENQSLSTSKIWNSSHTSHSPATLSTFFTRELSVLCMFSSWRIYNELFLVLVAGEFASGPLAADIRDVTVGKPFQLNCPKHSYMRGCVYNWGKSNAFGMKHLKRYQNRVILSNGTLLFSAITQRDVDDFSKDDYQCIVDCWFGNFHSMSRSHSVYLNKRAGKNLRDISYSW